MLFTGVLQRFAQKYPVCVMIRALLENALAPKKLDGLFGKTRKAQYQRELLFSSTVDLMSLVVSGVHKSVHAAYQADPEAIGVSVTAVYDKLAGIEPPVSAELTRHTYRELNPIVQKLGACLPPLLPGYRSRILDGNALAGTEHRIRELRKTKEGALPGKSLVVLDPSAMLIADLFPCEDGHAQERSLFGPVLQTVQKNDVWIADRNFCTLGFLFGIADRGAYFVVRLHKNLPFECHTRYRSVGRVDGATVSERTILLNRPEEKDGLGSPHPPKKKQLKVRCIRLSLDTPTRDGDREMFIVTQLPPKHADACRVADIYRKRWTLETAFQTLTECLCCEINTLGYPKAALFGFSVAVCAYNIVSTVKAALRAVHGRDKVENEVSSYYLADEISRVHCGMEAAIEPRKWSKFQTLSTAALVAVLRQLAENVDLRHFRKHPRGPKKPQPRRVGKNGGHVSTAKLLAARQADV
jgi:IS4 transposase